MPVLSRTSCLRSGGVKTVPHLGIAGAGHLLGLAARERRGKRSEEAGKHRRRLLETDLCRIRLTIWPFASAVLSRGSTRWRVTREGRELGRARRSCSPRNQASGLVRPSLLARSCLRPDPSVRSLGSARLLLFSCPLGPRYRHGPADVAGGALVRRVAGPALGEGLVSAAGRVFRRGPANDCIHDLAGDVGAVHVRCRRPDRAAVNACPSPGLDRAAAEVRTIALASRTARDGAHDHFRSDVAGRHLRRALM